MYSVPFHLDKIKNKMLFHSIDEKFRSDIILIHVSVFILSRAFKILICEIQIFHFI